MIKFKWRKSIEEIDEELIIHLKSIVNEGVTPKGWQEDEVEEAQSILESGIITVDQEDWIRGLFE